MAVLGVLSLSLSLVSAACSSAGDAEEGTGGAGATVTGTGGGITMGSQASTSGVGTTGVSTSGAGTNGVSTAGVSTSGGGTGAGGTAGDPGTTSGGVTMGMGAATTGGGDAGVGGTTSSGTTTTSTTTTSGGGSGGQPPLDDRSAEGTCLRWNADHENLDEGTWSGSVETCDPGDISPDGRDNALRLYNLYRWLADLPAVETSPERNSMAQACALIMEANNDLSHDPGMDWACWTQEGADGAASSNLASGPSVAVVSGYMIDPGNATTLGHRRWILSNSLGPIGIGSTGQGASCMQNLGGEGRAGKAWVAWPPPGAFPMQAYGGAFGQSLSETGWSIQSDSIDLGDATVTVMSEDEALAVSVTQLGGGYGSRYAIRFNPEGWEPEAGRAYSVDVGGVESPISYEVQFVDCD